MDSSLTGQTMFQLLQFALTSMFVSAVLVAFLLYFARDWAPIDRPNHRSLHKGEIPRIGGIGVVVACLSMVWSLSESDDFLRIYLISGSLILAFVSLWDDFHDISPLIRLGIQVTAAVLLAIGVFKGRGNLAFCLGVVLVIVWSINLYNFMDGLDGLAGSMAVIGFGALGVIGYFAGDIQYAQVMAVIVGSSLGFLVFNLPPARIFMGDAGSTFLGYTMAAASLWGISSGLFPFWVPLIIFLPFWLDATVTLLRRLFNRERIWEAHRSHFYQHAVLSGMSVLKVLLIEVSIMLMCAAVAIGGAFIWMSGG